MNYYPDTREAKVVRKPKKVKFHNNLRSKLNTGGVKWLS